MQPGHVINPGDDQTSSEQATASTPEPVEVSPDNQPAPANDTPVFQEQTDAPASPEVPIQPVDHSNDLVWTASEFIEAQKPQGWYMTVALGALLVSGVLYLLLRDWITVGVVAVAAVLFGVVGARKPRAMTYNISSEGLKIGDKSYPYALFKSFSLIEEGAIDSIQFSPFKRFMPPISIYFPPDQEQLIVEKLADYLPHEDRSHDTIDRLMRRLHF